MTGTLDFLALYVISNNRGIHQKGVLAFFLLGSFTVLVFIVSFFSLCCFQRKGNQEGVGGIKGLRWV